jgi:TPR repeat protein
MASVQSAPLPQRRASETFGAPSTARRGIVAIDVSKPPYTRQFVDEYRTRMKNDPDPEAQFSFAKYLIEAAKKIGDEMSARDPRSGRKYRDSLLAESLRNIKKLAEGKDPYADAQFFLANLYGTGQLGLQVDHERAYYLYLMASKAGHPAATYRAAVCCELGAGTKRDPGRAVLFHRKAAALGDTAAMYKLGLILLNGTSEYKKNPIEAHKWLRRAAEQGDEDNPHALFELALLHERPNNGTGGAIPFDPGLARGYLTQAAQLGYAPAQFKLGQCHEFGWLGFPIDPRRSIAWYTRAAERGDSEAELALSGWYLTGSEGVLKQSDTEAYLWGRKAANKGLAKAEYAVGCEWTY